METITSGILILTPFFSPNIGGVETHLDDLIRLLKDKPCRVFVHTYSPLTTKIKYISRESLGNIDIYRYKWFSGNIFPKLEKFPLLDFIYLTPYLFLRTFIWLIFNHHKVTIIHSQGLNAAFIGNIFAYVFKKKHIVSLHAIYDHISARNPFVVSTLLNTDKVFTLSQASKRQLVEWGIPFSKITVYHYWIDTDNFRPSNTCPNCFTITFVGRLISKKGIFLFLKAASFYPSIKFIVIGTGPCEAQVKNICSHLSNVTFAGQIANIDLPQYINKSSVLCVPSLYNEGFGRVIMEALASGIPVIASNLGGIPEALDPSVSILFEPNLKGIKRAITQISSPPVYKQLRSQCRQFAIDNFSSNNGNIFLDQYDL